MAPLEAEIMEDFWEEFWTFPPEGGEVFMDMSGSSCSWRTKLIYSAFWGAGHHHTPAQVHWWPRCCSRTAASRWPPLKHSRGGRESPSSWTVGTKTKLWHVPAADRAHVQSLPQLDWWSRPVPVSTKLRLSTVTVVNYTLSLSANVRVRSAR